MKETNLIKKNFQLSLYYKNPLPLKVLEEADQIYGMRSHAIPKRYCMGAIPHFSS